MSKKHRKNTAEKNERKTLRGVLAGVISAALLLAVYALIISRSIMTNDSAVIGVTLINLISALICGVFSGAAGEGRAKASLAAGAIYAALILIIAASINIDLIKIGSAVRIIACSIVGAVIGGVLHLGKSNKKHRKKFKTRN